MVRVGIVGIGFMGMIHYLAYKNVPGAKVAAICTRDKKKLAGDWRGIKGNFGSPGTIMGTENGSELYYFMQLKARFSFHGYGAHAAGQRLTRSDRIRGELHKIIVARCGLQREHISAPIAALWGRPHHRPRHRGL